MGAGSACLETSQKFDLVGPEGGVGCFEDERHVIKPVVGHDEAEAVEPDESFAEAVVSVNPRGEFLFGVVEVHAHQMLEPNDLLKFVKRGFAGIRRA